MKRVSILRLFYSQINFLVLDYVSRFCGLKSTTCVIANVSSHLRVSLRYPFSRLWSWEKILYNWQDISFKLRANMWFEPNIQLYVYLALLSIYSSMLALSSQATGLYLSIWRKTNHFQVIDKHLWLVLDKSVPLLLVERHLRRLSWHN